YGITPRRPRPPAQQHDPREQHPAATEAQDQEHEVRPAVVVEELAEDPQGPVTDAGAERKETPSHRRSPYGGGDAGRMTSSTADARKRDGRAGPRSCAGSLSAFRCVADQVEQD